MRLIGTSVGLAHRDLQTHPPPPTRSSSSPSNAELNGPLSTHGWYVMVRVLLTRPLDATLRSIASTDSAEVRWQASIDSEIHHEMLYILKKNICRELTLAALSTTAWSLAPWSERSESGQSRAASHASYMSLNNSVGFVSLSAPTI